VHYTGPSIFAYQSDHHATLPLITRDQRICSYSPQNRTLWSMIVICDPCPWSCLSVEMCSVVRKCVAVVSLGARKFYYGRAMCSVCESYGLNWFIFKEGFVWIYVTWSVLFWPYTLRLNFMLLDSVLTKTESNVSLITHIKFNVCQIVTIHWALQT